MFLFLCCLDLIFKEANPFSLLCELLTLELDQIKFLCFLEIVFFWLSSEKGLLFFIEKKSMYLKKKFWGILILYYILI